MEMKELSSLFVGKRVLLTGDTGFKGSWLAFWLHHLGADVTGYALSPKRAHDHFNALQLNKLIHHVDGDINDFSHLSQVVSDFQPEFIFHLAAQPIVRESYLSPKVTFDTNVGGSVNILELARMTASVRSVIYVTSDKCYKNKEWIWGYRENDELGGHDPYSASKAAAEIVYQAYQHSFFEKNPTIGVASVRAGNVIGGGDWSQDRIVPDAMRALTSNQAIQVRHPAATRPWQYVLDPLFGYLLLAVKLYQNPKTYSGAWNFGPNFQAMKTVRDLVNEIVTHWGKGEVIFAEQNQLLHESTKLHLNCDKAHELLGWQPQWDFDQAVFYTTMWYKKIAEGASALAVTKQHIDDYMQVLT